MAGRFAGSAAGIVFFVVMVHHESVSVASCTLLQTVHHGFILLCWIIEPAAAVVKYLILYVEKVARSTPWEQVTHIFCRVAEGRLLKMSYYDAVRQVGEGTACFYVIHQERQVELALAHDALENECLRAVIDGQKIDVLLRLPDYRNGGD